MFNGVIQHHLSDNPNLIYGVLSAHKVFEDLGTFTLTKALREIKRVRAIKDQQGQGNDTKRPSQEDDNEDTSEKARLLVSESSQDLASGPNETTSGVTDSPDGPIPLPLTSPTSETMRETTQGPPSEKARGKQKERRSSSLEIDLTIERIAALGIGRNGFVPSQEWVRLILLSFHSL